MSAHASLDSKIFGVTLAKLSSDCFNGMDI